MMKQLFDDLFMQHHQSMSDPTLDEIEPASSYSYANHQDPYMSHQLQRIWNLNKVNNEMNKYTLRIKSFGNKMADDGYKWRKYGQKYIKNSPNPRSYYRCRNCRCSAKKQVERSTEDPDTLVITYEGLHLHYTHLMDQPQPKKLKRPIPKAQHILDPKDNGLGTPDISPLNSQTAAQGLLEDVVPLMIRRPLLDYTSF